MADVPDLPPDGWTNNLSPDDFVSYSQRLLREEFATLTQQNGEQLQIFDPNNPDSSVEVPLYTPFTEIENEEPALTIAQSQAMLENLGLNFRLLPLDDPNLLVQLPHDDDTLTQIRYVNREDGVRVPLMSSLDENGKLVGVHLLSNERTQEAIEYLQPELDAYNKNIAISGLAEMMKIGDEEMDAFYEGADKLTLQELQAMVQDLQNEAPEVVEGDNEFSKQMNDEAQAYKQKLAEKEAAINKARRSYARAAMPTNTFLDGFMRKRVAERRQQYQQLVEENLRQLEYVGQHAELELDKEQGRRHAELNEQMRKRKTFAKIGAAAITGAADLLGIASITAYGYLNTGDSITTEKALGASVVMSAVFSTVQFFRMRNRLKYAVPFDQESTATPNEPLNNQLEAEKAHASRIKRIFRSMQEL